MNQNFFIELLDDGYDVFVLTFGSSNQDSLIDNSQSVLAALNYIQTLSSNMNSTLEPIKIIGYSMGGILARLALSYAEEANLPHFSNFLITLDSPHRGILINDNAQSSLNSELTQEILPESLELMIERIFQSPAAKQMIRNNIFGTNAYVSTGSEEYREIFGILNNSDSGGQELLNGTGYPHKQNLVHKYALALGSNTLSGNVNNNNNFANIGWELRWGGLRLDSGNVTNIPSTWYDKTPASLVPIRQKYTEVLDRDNWWDFLDEYISMPKVHLVLSLSYIPPMVPTISSLCIESTPFTYGHFNSPLPASFSTPFDDYYISSTPQYHNTIPADAASWMMDKLNSTELRSIGYASGTVYSEAIAFPGATISVKNIQTNETYYTTSNELGEYSFPLFYLSPCEYQITIAGDGYYSSKQTHSIQPNHLGNAELPNTTLSKFNLNNIIVSVSNPTFFSSISEALLQVYNFCSTEAYNSEPVKIKVLSGTYDDDLNLFWLTAAGVENFTLEGIGDVTLSGNSCGIRLLISEIDQIDNAVYTINNLKISGFEKGLIYKDYYEDSSTLPYNGHITLNVINCRFEDCGNNAHNFPDVSAAAVHFEGAGIIENCTFINNSINGSYYTPYSSYLTGGIFVRNDSQGMVKVNNCLFEGNSGGEAGALVVTGLGEVVVSNNNFKDNALVSSSETFGMKGKDLSVYLASNTEIRHNVFEGEQGSSVGLKSYESQPSNPCSDIIFENNTISYTVNAGSNTRTILKFKICSDPSIQDIQFRNNVFMSNVPNICRVSKSIGYHPAIFEHNILYNVTTAEASFVLNTTDPDEPLYNHLCNPMLNTNFVPIWNDTIMSPCIDTGIGDPDPDGTPPDIGAKRAVEHAFWEYTFEDQADADRWHWVSYPVLNTITDNALKASVFFEELLHVHQKIVNGLPVDQPTYLDSICWMEGEPKSISWLSGSWFGPVDFHFVSSPQGYKIKLKQDLQETVTLIESGFKTPENLQFPIYGGVENWLGYFKEDAQYPDEAFAVIWDDINMVRGKNWSLTRNSNGAMVGKKGTLNYGDMVIVTTNSNHSFRWGSGIPVPPRIKEASESFIYDEKPDYIPVYINIPDDMMMDLCEIGLYVDGVCKGAVVVDGPFEQVSAYVDSPDELSGDDVEFVFCYEEGKRAGNELRAMNLNPGRLQPQYGIAGASYPYFEIKLTQDDMDEIVPPEFSLRQNYPNPFNPSTTISYWLPETARVRLDIYNLKGQLVKTLIDSEMAAGLHSVVWNGKDSNNQAVASGVYFYRISSPNNTQTKRMLLMK
ncbi:MAG: T9SS type A sorting domain-containing protein [Candidatus Cloacimonadaceae bacterium]